MHGDSLYSKYGGILLWTDFWFKILLKFKASMPLLANFIFRNGRFFVSTESQTLTALNNLFQEMSKIIPWSRCSGDPTSVKCKVSVDSYNTCSVFKGREYILVRIWWRPNCKLTNDRRPSKETVCISALLYLLEPWLRCLLLVRSNRFKNIHWLASRTGKISYAIDMVVATIWSSSSQLSNPVFLSFPTKGGTWVYRLVCGMIYLLENSNFHGEDGMIGQIKVSVE